MLYGIACFVNLKEQFDVILTLVFLLLSFWSINVSWRANTFRHTWDLYFYTCRYIFIRWWCYVPRIWNAMLVCSCALSYVLVFISSQAVNVILIPWWDICCAAASLPQSDLHIAAVNELNFKSFSTSQGDWLCMRYKSRELIYIKIPSL